MKREQIKELMSVHFDRCEEFKSKWFEVSCVVEDKQVHASFIKDETIGKFRFYSIGYNYDDVYDTNKLSTFIIHNDDTLIVFETVYESNNEDVYYFKHQEMSLLHSDYMMIGKYEQIKLYNNEESYKILELDECNISKDEYFNYSIEYDIPPYELYEYAKGLFDINEPHVMTYIATPMIEYIKNEA